MSIIKSEIFIRDAFTDDIPDLCELINFLGYETNIEDMTERFNNINSHSDFRTIVATIDDKIVGMAGVTQNYSYESNGKYLRIIAFVTHADYYCKGIGTKMLNFIENWGKEIHANSIRLNCGNRFERESAHLFYSKKGFSAKSTGYLKKL